MFSKEFIVKMLLDWAKKNGEIAVRGAIQELMTQNSADLLYFISCFPPDILEEALKRAKAQKDFEQNAFGEGGIPR